ncbi:hypothetical protein H072_4031 [Dactylellina haptotyla CBS 200.50]|uniref:Uncharacterized protein n=1 Tax=Dactylellina haptotyla (strain CBS 200.50) TaxID=1284197 RepID=S8AG51_DACHA|nr:hypothetical protein H072_4031 [Dactylellina haptotyla CBS 200.50]
MADETAASARSSRPAPLPPPPPPLLPPPPPLLLNTSPADVSASSTASNSRSIINGQATSLRSGNVSDGRRLSGRTPPPVMTSMNSNHSRSLSHPVNRTVSLNPSTSFPPGPATATFPLSAATSTTSPTSGFSIPAPLTPTRPSLPCGLSLQLPSLQLPSRNEPLPPYLDPALGFSTVRRPRLDFTRSCTSLHHSFVADSPDSSPLTPSMPIPRRGLDSPIAMYTGGTGAGSILSTMLADSRVDSDSSSDSSSDDDEMELTSAHSQFGPSLPGAGGVNELFNSSALLNRRHMTRLRGKGRSSRQSSSSASASSTSLASPSPTTPPNGETKKNGGNSGNGSSGGYFGSQLSDLLAQRRQSISQAMKKIGFMSGSGASDDGKGDCGKQLDAVRRPVVRRGNLLPKPKHFQRVKAALIEEATPIDAEMRIEAAIQRQLRDEDEEEDTRTVPQTPVLGAQPEDENPLVFEDTEDELPGLSFKTAAQRNSGYWGTLESSSPSGGFMGFRVNTDGDIIMGTDSMVNSPISRSPEVRKLKRRRDDDDLQFDTPSIIKRRAVSPGFSQSPTVSSSPVAIPANGNRDIATASGTRSKRSSYIQDAHDGMSKMSISPFI